MRREIPPRKWTRTEKTGGAGKLVFVRAREAGMKQRRPRTRGKLKRKKLRKKPTGDPGVMIEIERL